MLKDIYIKNYRGIKDLKIKDFKRINILVGDNNCGKTSVLESIGLSINYNITGIIHFENFRAKFPESQYLTDQALWNDFEYLFYEKKYENFEILSTTEDLEKNLNQTKIKCYLTKNLEKFSNSTNFTAIDQRQNNSLIAEYSENEKNLVKLGYSRDGTANEISNLKAFTPISMISSSPIKSSNLIQLITKVVEENDEDFFSKIAQNIDVKIKSIKTAGEQIYADIGKISVPLKYMGDGLSKVLHILLRIRASENGILLIDEIENGLHWKTQTILWRAIILAAVENNVQIIATTHSRDTIKALSEVCEEEKSLIGDDEIRVFQLYKNDKNFSETLDEKTIKGMIKNNYELR